jgi:rhodanese-related sulfurtransferase
MKKIFKATLLLLGLLFFNMQCRSKEEVNFRELLQNPNTVIIDVRSPEEFAAGHIRQSINIPLPEISGSMERLEEFDYVIFVCRTGNRSGQARGFLIEREVENVYNGGAWNVFQRRYMQ